MSPLEPDPADTGEGSAAELNAPALPFLLREHLMTSTLGQTRTDTAPLNPPEAQSSSFEASFPNSTKVYIAGPRGIRIPMREISLSGGEPPLRVYDTSGPQDLDVRNGLPRLREAWVRLRGVAPAPSRAERAKGDNGAAAPLPRCPAVHGTRALTQLYYARKNEI